MRSGCWSWPTRSLMRPSRRRELWTLRVEVSDDAPPVDLEEFTYRYAELLLNEWDARRRGEGGDHDHTDPVTEDRGPHEPAA